MLRLLAVLLFSFSLFAQQLVPILPDPGPGPFPRPRPLPHALPQLRTTALTIAVEIRDQRAETEWRQTFHNFGGGLGEADWIFALPNGADLTHFELAVNGRKLEAELLDAAKAEQLYLEIVRKRRDPGLLEMLGSGAIRVRIFPIEAGADREVTLKYGQILEQDSGLTRYVLPLRALANGNQRLDHFALSLDLKMAGGLKTLFSPTHELVETARDGVSAKWNLKEKDFRTERDFECLFSSGRDAVGMDLTYYQDGADGYFMLAVTPSWKEQKERTAKDILFVVDSSGSMQGPKMEQAKRALRYCIDALGAEDRFQLIHFGTESARLFSGWKRADAEARKAAKSYVDDLVARGGTNLEEALKEARALAVDSKRVQIALLLSDGMATVGEMSEDGLAREFERPDSRMRLFPLGIGNDVNTVLLDRLARAGRGWRTYVGDKENIELKVSQLYDKIAAPVMTDLALEAEGVALDRVYPKPLPDLFRGMTLTLVGRCQGSGKALVRLRGKLAGQEKLLEQAWDWKKRSERDNYLPRLWAQRRVGYLLDEIRRNGQSSELQSEIEALAKRYQILTPFTSYLILEDEAKIQAQRSLDSRGSLAPASPSMGAGSFSKLEERSGAASVAASEMIQDLVTTAAPPRNGTVGESPYDPSEPAKVTSAAGRAFLLRDGVWHEAGLEPENKAKRSLVFASKAYFEALAAHKILAPIFALGDAVRFRFEGEIWEILPETK